MAIPRTKIFLFFILAAPLIAGAALADVGDIGRCLERADLPRIARVGPGASGRPVYVRVLEHAGGAATVVSPLGDADLSLGEAVRRAQRPLDPGAHRIEVGEDANRVCAPVPLTQQQIDDESRVIVAAGLNYAAHAEEAGGGDVFLFPKPSQPGAPGAMVTPPAGVSLLDYEVELAFVLLEDVDLSAIPGREQLLAQSAFFVSNDITDREPIIVHKAFSGPGTGFVEAKGQPGFLPTGPWLVRGSELFAALAECGGEGLRLQLDVDEGQGFESRQDATTAAMILDPHALLVRIAEEVKANGARTPMPVELDGEVRHYPFAIPDADGRLHLPAGSVVLTGTPDGVAMQAPDVLPLMGRALVNLRGPFEQVRQEQLELAARGEPGGYLAAGDRVRARIDGLGTQSFRIGEAGDAAPPDPCSTTTGGTNE